MLEKFLGRKCRIIVRKNNQTEIDLICRQLDKETAELFSKYKFVHYKTHITELNVIELVKE